MSKDKGKIIDLDGRIRIARDARWSSFAKVTIFKTFGNHTVEMSNTTIVAVLSSTNTTSILHAIDNYQTRDPHADHRIHIIFIIIVCAILLCCIRGSMTFMTRTRERRESRRSRIKSHPLSSHLIKAESSIEPTEIVDDVQQYHHKATNTISMSLEQMNHSNRYTASFTIDDYYILEEI